MRASLGVPSRSRYGNDILHSWLAQVDDLGRREGIGGDKMTPPGCFPVIYIEKTVLLRQQVYYPGQYLCLDQNPNTKISRHCILVCKS